MGGNSSEFGHEAATFICWFDINNAGLMSGERGKYSAAESALGYFYQVRYALLESLRRQRKVEQFTVSIETLDDVVFEDNGEALALLQMKHHVKTVADLTDYSTDLWKSIRVWCDAYKKKLASDTVYYLITTGSVASGQASSYLGSDKSRDAEAAMKRLNSSAESSTSQENASAYQAYKELSLEDRKKLLESVYILDKAELIEDLDEQLREVVFYAVEEKFLESLLQRLEGWWYRRAIKHLREESPSPILSEELSAEMVSLREQFKQESLPVDDDIMSASVDASGYQDRVFVEQLKMIEIGNNRILYAVKNFFRAFEQRSRWIREDLLLVGELERYEDRLVEEWDILFQQMIEELGEEATEEKKKKAAQALYKWVETGSHAPIRPGVSEIAIARGSYQMLSDAQRVGWHAEFGERIRKILELRGAEK